MAAARGGGETTAGAGREVDDLAGLGARSYDFRRPDKFTRDEVRTLQVAHEVFARRLASGLGGVLRALVQIEPLSADQMSFDDYVRSMPNPTVVSTLGLAPMPGPVTLELDVALTLLLVDRLLGGRGGRGPAALPERRRPTDLETFLVRDLVAQGVEAVGEAVSTLVDVGAELAATEFNPQLVQIAPPSETVLLLTYRMTVSQGSVAEGLLTLCYPAAQLTWLFERLGEQHGEPGAGLGADAAARAAVTDQLRDVEVDLAARLRPSHVTAGDLMALRVGDVLQLDHRTDEPCHLALGEIPVLQTRLGRRGRRLAVQVDRWLAGPVEPATDLAGHLPLPDTIDDHLEIA